LTNKTVKTNFQNEAKSDSTLKNQANIVVFVKLCEEMCFY